jgi:hypothetical protein
MCLSSNEKKLSHCVTDGNVKFLSVNLCGLVGGDYCTVLTKHGKYVVQFLSFLNHVTERMNI